MNFLIADTFTDSLGRLTGDEQKAVKTTAFDLQLNPVSTGLSFHKLDKARDKNFWSVRVNRDVRLIVHKTSSSLLLCYVDHHDKAYSWAERRKLETHPQTGAAQLVEIRETIQEIVVPTYVEGPARTKTVGKRLFDGHADDILLGYGVPPEWLADVRAATEETLFAVAEHLPGEAAEALLELATGGKPRVPQPAAAGNSFEHPDAQRRFRVMGSAQELAQALDYPWEKWTVFLHPEQRRWVEKDYAGPARVSGSAGTGKTIVALHRAAHLARKFPDARILLATFSDPLSNSLQTLLNRLLCQEPKLSERIDVHSLTGIALRLHKLHRGAVTLVAADEIRRLILDASKEVPGLKYGLPFLVSEWEQIVDPWQLDSWEAYRDVPRLGRKTRIAEAQRKLLWSIFDGVRTGLRTLNMTTEAGLFTSVADLIKETRPPFEFAVIDEAQDLSVAQMRFLVSVSQGRPDALFFTGDLGQRIFQQPFSWKAQGVDVRGRSRTLRINYRTSHQIRTQADRLLGPAVSDVDGNSEDRSDTVSVFDGPPPTIRVTKSESEEVEVVSSWLTQQSKSGVLPQETAIFVRSPAQLARAHAAAQTAGVPFDVLDERGEVASGRVTISTMHLAKGLEFRAVAVMACDDEIVPLQERIEAVGDDADLKEVYDTERHLLYVACTRARDALLITSVAPASEFLDDLKA